MVVLKALILDCSFDEVVVDLKGLALDKFHFGRMWWLKHYDNGSNINNNSLRQHSFQS